MSASNSDIDNVFSAFVMTHAPSPPSDHAASNACVPGTRCVVRSPSSTRRVAQVNFLACFCAYLGLNGLIGLSIINKEYIEASIIEPFCGTEVVRVITEN